jgi:outer membrane lipoprotein-sorting protein
MRSLAVVALAAMLAPGATASEPIAAPTLLAHIVDADPWGFGDAEVAARAILTDKRGSTSELVFSSRSLRYAPSLSKSLVRFSAPADLAGAGFLQIQRGDGDDERYLFLPELKTARRVAGALRATAFMGTDFSFEDLDRRGLRDGAPTLDPDEKLGKYDCYRLTVIPKASQYKRLELWVRKDDLVPLKTEMYDQADVLMKTLTAREVKRIGERSFIVRSSLVNHKEAHTTELILEKVTPTSAIPDDEFTTRNLEKL